jgi:8-oxo-dGTP diphosphatase
MINCEFENGDKANLRHASIDALVVKNGKILLVKRAPGLREGGKWGDIGGFLDFNETSAEAVEREVFEETGYKVTSLTLFRILDLPHRRGDDRQMVSLVYICSVGDKVGEPDKESTEQRWFALDDLPSEADMAFDHLDNIVLYKKYLQQEFKIPFVNFDTSNA